MDDRITQYIPNGTWGLVSLFDNHELTRGCPTTLRSSQKDSSHFDRIRRSKFTPSSPGHSLTEQEDVLPAEKLYHSQVSTDPALRWKSTPAILESLKRRAKDLGLWNLWLSGGEFQGMAGGQGGGLSNLEVSHVFIRLTHPHS